MILHLAKRLNKKLQVIRKRVERVENFSCTNEQTVKPFDADCSRNVIDTHPAEDQTNAPHILVWMGLRTLIQQLIVSEDCVCRKTSFYGTISFLTLYYQAKTVGGPVVFPVFPLTPFLTPW